MKVLLINSNVMKPPVGPIGLEYLADTLRADGHEHKLLDLCFSSDIRGDAAAAVSSFGPDAVGVSVRNTDDCFFASRAFFLPGIREIIEALRQASDAPIVLGGVGFSVMPEAVMDFCGCDFGIAGEGERSLSQLLAAMEAGGGFDTVPGLLHRENGQLRRNPGISIPLELLPPRSRSLADNPRYFREGGQAGFETKRGCPKGCVYCADPVSKGRSVRLRPPRTVAEELRALLAQGIDHFHTCDSEFNVPIDHAREICAAIIEGGMAERMRWYAYCSILPFDAETAKLLRRAGCAGINFGADSGNAEVLHSLGRDFRPEDLERTAECCRAAGMPFMYDLLAGGPGETRDTIRETVDFVRRIGADCVGVSVGVRVYGGTPLSALVRKSGPMESNPSLHGETRDNPHFLKPVFYVSPQVGADIEGYVRQLVGNDERFFLPSGPEAERDYNYNDNTLLVKAISNGARGAYWDILRRMRGAR